VTGGFEVAKREKRHHVTDVEAASRRVGADIERDGALVKGPRQRLYIGTLLNKAAFLKAAESVVHVYTIAHKEEIYHRMNRMKTNVLFVLFV
jgi:hypothetical protein